MNRVGKGICHWLTVYVGHLGRSRVGIATISSEHQRATGCAVQSVCHCLQWRVSAWSSSCKYAVRSINGVGAAPFDK